ncbi:MFS transporter [Arthrobacter sp. zg-Y411]|uniref:MFS transporter n=1 Tax=Arthrobacter zhangbolii TaxID=2886936 RepID=UPI001D148F6B|nr:MFS transporter [Arthrobacter zhangbolii]MCC3294321.1 MFS transporter [Arthrobacter zhangbolii]
MKQTNTPVVIRTTDKKRRRAFLGATAGHLIEWYDYGIYGFLAVYMGANFFASDTPGVSLLSSFAVFALSFFIRPIGGIFFGPLADKLGRRRTLLMVLILMGGSTFLIGLLPTGDTIGVMAPILLILIRCVQGFSAGGEIGTITSFISEYAENGKRGFATSWLMVTAVVGLLIGGVVANSLIYLLGSEAMTAWGWRLPFLIAGPLALIAIYIRMKLEDSPEFRELQANGETSKAPLRDVFQYRRQLVLVFFIITLHSSIFYLVLTYMSTFMSTTLKFSSGTTLIYVFVSSLLAAVAMPFGGAFTDRFGRKPFLLVIGVLATITMGWLFMVAPGATPGTFLLPLLATGLLFGLYASSTYATMSELLPTRVRSTGIAVAYNVPVAVFGGAAPFIAQALVDGTGEISSPAYFFVATGVVSIVALLALKSSDFVGLSSPAQQGSAREVAAP